MTETTPSGDKHLMLQAAVDGELDAAGMLAFERSLGEDEALAAEYRRLLALRQAFRGEAFRNLAKVPASAALRAHSWSYTCFAARRLLDLESRA